MKEILMKYMPLLVSGLLFGYSIVYSIDTKFVYAILLVLGMMLLYAKPSYNMPLYIKSGSLLIGIIIGIMVKVLDCDVIGFWCGLWLPWKILLVYTFVVEFVLISESAWRKYHLHQTENIKLQSKWKERNLYRLRAYDLERLKELVFDQNIASIGLEAVWGQGKSFLVEGLREAIDERNIKESEVKVEVIMVDVLAVRMDKFPEYIIGELDNVLYKNGRISNNKKKLKSLFKNIKLDVVSRIWEDTDESYNKIFDNFRKEILRLGKIVLIIYEDIDRLEDKKAISDIFYLTEKLTAANEVARRGGIKAIYQYDRKHMEQIGFSVQFMEKYIRRHMDLSVVSFEIMLRKIQEQVKGGNQWDDFSNNVWLTDDEIMDLVFVKSEINYWFPEEKDWTERYLTQRLTIRRTVDFYNATLDKLRDKSFSDKASRKCILAFYFIQYFLPMAYQQIKEAQTPHCSLWSVFRVSVKEKEIYFMDKHKEVKRKRQQYINTHQDWVRRSQQFVDDDFVGSIDYQKHTEAFELFVAYRLLFGDENILFEYDKSWIGYNQAEFYAASADVVYKRESLGYVNTERMVRYLLQAGYASSDDYVYWANDIVSQIFSYEDKTCWQDKFEAFWLSMQNDERGAETIHRFKVHLWSNIFRAFVFAGRTWEKTEKENNFINIVELYEIDKKQGRSKGESEEFSQIFIEETLPLWEGLTSGVALCRFAEVVVQRKVVCNWNEYANFYRYIKAALMAIADNSYWVNYDFWELEIIEQEIQAGKWNECKSLIERILSSLSKQLDKDYKTLLNAQERGVLPQEAAHFRSLRELIEYFRKVMKAENVGREKTKTSIRPEVHDHVAEAYRKALAIKDEEEFKRFINNPANGIGIANCVRLIREREKAVNK